MGENRYGVDVRYFSKELKQLEKSLPNRKPDELYRYLIVLAKVIKSDIDLGHSLRGDQVWCDIENVPADRCTHMDLGRAIGKIETLQSKLAVCEKALDFYGDKGSYCCLFIPELPKDDPRTFAPVLRDDGKIATEALKEINGG